jgi:hypothetical protein
MKRISAVGLIMLLLLVCAGCYAPITGKIVDADTGQPIEGAIVLVEWTKAHGFGNTYHTSEKAAEIFSDKDGIVKIPGYNDPFAEKPDITIYKNGYVAWNNHTIFPDDRNRNDFEWKNDYVFRLERFKERYSHFNHEMFIVACTKVGLDNKNKGKLLEIARKSEMIERNNELIK